MMKFAIAAAVLVASATLSQAAVQTVDSIGSNGWRSDDTRASGGTNLIGTTSTHAPGSSPAASPADDAAIAGRIGFVNGPAGSTNGALQFTKTGGGDKNTFSTINPSGFAASSGGNSWANGLTGSFRYNTNSTAEAPALRIGVRSTNWGTSQTGFTAGRSGESSWDYMLTTANDTPLTNVWTDHSIDTTTTIFRLFRQAGNGFLPTAGGYGETGTPNQFGRTLAQWAADATYGPLLFGDGALVSNVQVGIGSSSQVSTTYVDGLQLSFFNGGDAVDFAVVPEPTTLAAVAAGALVLLGRRRRKA